MGQVASSDGKRLFNAIKKDDAEAVRSIVAASPRAVLYKSFWKQQTPLMAASRKGNILTVSTLLWATERALDDGSYLGYLDDADTKGNTALAIAAKGGHATVIRVLLEEGATPLTFNRAHNSALHVAAVRGHAQCVQLLLDAPVRAPGGQMVHAAQAVVRDGAGEQYYVDAHNRYGFAPLHLAVMVRSASVASALVQRGAALDAPVMRGLDRMPFMCGGSTPLHIAAAQGDTRLCSILLDAQWRHPGLELRRIRNALGLTPLNCALLAGNNEVVRLLVEPRRAGGGSGAASSAALVRSAVLRSAFPESLRRHMLSLLRRAALLVELKQIAGEWGAKGAGRPSDQVLAGVPGLETLSLPQIRRLQRSLQREGTSLRDVLFGLESALHECDGSDGSDGSEAEAEEEEREAAAGAGGGGGGGGGGGHLGVDWTMLGRNLVLSAHPGLAPSATARMREQRRTRRQARHHASEGANAASAVRARMRQQRRLHQTLAEVVSLAEVQLQPGAMAAAAPPGGGGGGGGEGGKREASEAAAAAAAVSYGQDECSICMDSGAEVTMQPCRHALCLQCAWAVCVRQEAVSCPFCRQAIDGVAAIPGARARAGCGACPKGAGADVVPAVAAA